MSFGSLPVGVGNWGGGGVPAPSAITLENVDPADFSTLGPYDPITFDVLASDLLRIIVGVEYPADANKEPELAFDGTSFKTGFSGSTQTAVSGGYRLVLRRSGGWTSRPAPLIFAFDTSGQEL